MIDETGSEDRPSDPLGGAASLTGRLLSLMTMLGIHSLAVLLAIVVAVLLVWAGWVVTSRVLRRSPGGAGQ